MTQLGVADMKAHILGVYAAPTTRNSSALRYFFATGHTIRRSSALSSRQIESDEVEKRASCAWVNVMQMLHSASLS
jgi:hypothetical protein